MVRDAAEQLTRAVGWSTDRLAMYGLIDDLIRPPEAIARITVAELSDPDPRLAAGAAQTVMELCWGLTDPEVGWPDPPDGWWATPLGRLTGRALGRDPDDSAVTMAIPAVMELLGVSRAWVYQLLAQGRLIRGPDGRVLRSSVGQVLADRDL